MEVILDDNFGLSDGESSEEEAVEQFYAHTGDPVLARSEVEVLSAKYKIKMSKIWPVKTKI